VAKHDPAQAGSRKASLTGEAVAPEELIARADPALYRAKHAGRNRTLAAR
jgi:PleD family two-component response regulator